MKKTIIALAATAAVASANADFLGGWDFQDLTLASDLNAGIAQDIAGQLGGTLSSSTFIANTSQGAGQNTIDAADAFWGSNGFQGGVAGDNVVGTKGITTQGTNSFEIAFDATNFTDLDLAFMFDVINTGDYGTAFGPVYTDTINVELFDGVSSLGVLTNNGFFGSDANAVFDLDNGAGYSTSNLTLDVSALDGIANARVVITANANVTPGNIVFDNVGFSGTVVPEPSTYAAIFGAIALAFAASRRRK